MIETFNHTKNTNVRVSFAAQTNPVDSQETSYPNIKQAKNRFFNMPSDGQVQHISLTQRLSKPLYAPNEKQHILENVNPDPTGAVTGIPRLLQEIGLLSLSEAPFSHKSNQLNQKSNCNTPNHHSSSSVLNFSSLFTSVSTSEPVYTLLVHQKNIWLHNLYRNKDNQAETRALFNNIFYQKSLADNDVDNNLTGSVVYESISGRESRPSSGMSHLMRDKQRLQTQSRQDIQPSPAPWSDYTESIPSRPASSRHKKLRFEKDRPRTCNDGVRRSRESVNYAESIQPFSLSKKRPRSSPVGHPLLAKQADDRPLNNTNLKWVCTNRIPLSERPLPTSKITIKPRKEADKRPASSLSVWKLDERSDVHSCLRISRPITAVPNPARKAQPVCTNHFRPNTARPVSVLVCKERVPRPGTALYATSQGWLE